MTTPEPDQVSVPPDDWCCADSDDAGLGDDDAMDGAPDDPDHSVAAS